MEIEIIPECLQFKKPAGTSRGVYTTRQIYLIKACHNNTIGWGECAPLPDLSQDALSQDEYLTLLQRFTCEIEMTRQIPYEELRPYPSMLMGLESAMRHLHSGSWHHYPHTKFSKAESGIPINGLVWMGNIEEMNQRMQQKLKEGYTCIKLKIGALDFDDELQLVKKIRRQYSSTDVEIRVDANGGFQPGDGCMKKLEQLAQLNVHSIEQPIKQNQLDDLAKICQNSPIPIALDEELIGVNSLSEKKELLQYVRPQYIVLKPSLHGGFYGAEEWINEACKLNIKWWVTSALESNIGLNAIAQWTALQSNDQYSMAQGLGTGLLFVRNFDEVPLKLANGKLYTF